MYEETDRSNGPNNSMKQPWRSHPLGYQEEESRISESQEMKFYPFFDFHQLLLNAWIVYSGESHHIKTTKKSILHCMHAKVLLF
jgi:hypothetical protein